MTAAEWRLYPVVYDPNDQKMIISVIFESVFEQLADFIFSKSGDGDSILVSLGAGMGLSTLLLLFAPLIKHEAYRDEQEWRLFFRTSDPQVVLQNLEKGRPDVFLVEIGECKVRDRAGTLVPYKLVPLETEKVPFVLKEVIAGPSCDEELTLTALRLLLRDYGLHPEISVMKSDIPYRSQ